MSGQILVNFAEVYHKTAELRRYIETELREMDAAYRQVHSTLRGMDGKTNAIFVETMVANQRKAEIASETLHKLLLFMEHSAREVERNDQLHARIFASSRITRERGGADA